MIVLFIRHGDCRTERCFMVICLLVRTGIRKMGD